MIWWLTACHTPPAVIPMPDVVLEPGVPWSVPARAPIETLQTVAPAAAGLNPDKLALFDAYAFSQHGDQAKREGQRTNAIVVLRHGQIVYERYDRGVSADTPLLTWSVTKSFGASVYGAAVHEGLIDINKPVCTTYQPMCADGKQNIRYTDLLRMSSGLDWQETYETSPVFSSVMAMLYSYGSDDMAAYAAAKNLTAAPGTRWTYSSGDSNILSAALKKPLGDRYADYPYTALADRIGMTTARYEPDAAGTHVASSYLYASARDVARWGQLILDDGTWNGERLLAEGWVRYLSTLAPAFGTTEVGVEHHMNNPGAQWYVNVGDPTRGLAKPWPALPEDAFGASGHWGKFVWVVPSWDMVIVRMGDDRQYGCSYDVQPKCLADKQAAFTKTWFLELLANAVEPHEAPVYPPPVELELLEVAP